MCFGFKSKRASLFVTLLALAGCAFQGASRKKADDIEVNRLELGVLSGGEGTVSDTSPLAFSLALRGLPSDLRRGFAVGNAFFNDNWVVAPASTEGRDGLGPLFNAQSCSSCHLRDGRGRPPETGERMLSMLVRLSVPGQDQFGAPLPEPSYGGQLQNRAIPGVQPEGRVELQWEEYPGVFVDGSSYSLRKPKLGFRDLAYGDLHPEVQTSPRVAQSVFGLGLVEAIDDSQIEQHADPMDADGDGISGRTNRVWSSSLQREVLGRFGWKANVGSLRDQTSGAFLGDIGITSVDLSEQLFSEAQSQLALVPNGGVPELDEHKLARVVLYLQTLSPPARRHVEQEDVLRGQNLFFQIGCQKCHTPVFWTGDSHELEVLNGQRIQPFSDFLLHDMGDGLADGRPDFLAQSTEWRTAPLWGLGLQMEVSGHLYLLHDGRARGISEAILWHGGEAQSVRDAFLRFSAAQRADLEAFLMSL